VADYLGRGGAFTLRFWRWGPRDCRLLAQTAKAVLALKQKMHEVTGELVVRLLPADTPQFHKMLIRKIAEKLPLPPDVKLAAIARGLQIMGIYLCIIRDVPLDRCACLKQLGPEMIKERIKKYVEGPLDETWNDLKGRRDAGSARRRPSASLDRPHFHPSHPTSPG
jgi:hypothetical protein